VSGYAGGYAISTVEPHTHTGDNEGGTVDHGVLTGVLDNDHPLYQRKHGFDLGSTGVATQTLTYDKTARKITLTPTGSTFRFWIDGVEFVKTGAQVSGVHSTTTGEKFFYYDSAGALQVMDTPWSIRDRTVTPVAVVYWNNDLTDGVCFYECHTADRQLEIHYNLHFSRGCQWISGFDLTGYTLNTDSDAAVTYAIAAGVIADEDIKFDSAAEADGGPYSIFWREGATGVWKWTANDTFPFKYGATYPSYNQWTGATWQLTEVTGGGTIQYVNYYICATSAVSPAAASAFHIPGQAVYSSLGAAQAEGLSSLSLGTLPFEEVAPLYRVTLAIRNSFAGTYKCEIVQVSSLKNQTVTITGGAAVNPGSLVDSQTFTTTGAGTWIRPTSFTPRKIWVRCWAGGGGGGGGGAAATTTKRYGGAGGGGGAFLEKWFDASEIVGDQSLTVGVGGTAGPGAASNGTSGTDGGIGGPSTWGTTVRVAAYGGGGGRGGGTGGGGVYYGGGGGGTHGPGAVGTTSANSGVGGRPQFTVTSSIGCTGGGGANSGASATIGGSSEYGGAGGGTTNNSATPVASSGGTSLYGGGGGGGGGGVTATPGAAAAAAGGSSGVWPYAQDNGGAAGTAGGAGTAGAAGAIHSAGGGGGGGAASISVVGGAGGQGGVRGGGGGGGGAGTGSGGAGGAGGRGEIIVITFG
jgi:hypothetical protein